MESFLTSRVLGFSIWVLFHGIICAVCCESQQFGQYLMNNIANNVRVVKSTMDIGGQVKESS
jgi:hypothetical protein